MRVKYTGVVERIHRQPSRQGEDFPTLVYVKFDSLSTMQFQAPSDCPDVTGQGVALTLDIGQPTAAVYKSVPCPTCGMGVGGVCVSEIVGAPGRYRTVGYHVARRRAAVAAIPGAGQ